MVSEKFISGIQYNIKKLFPCDHLKFIRCLMNYAHSLKFIIFLKNLFLPISIFRCIEQLNDYRLEDGTQLKVQFSCESFHMTILAVTFFFF